MANTTVACTNINLLKESQIPASPSQNELYAVEIPSPHCSLLDFKWTDHIINDMAWLRADTFSWQDGTVYSNVYNHLEADISGKTLQSETIGETTVQFYLADDGHKICPASEESNVSAIYTATGVAWYYIVDTTNQRFKLPRTKYGFTGLRDVVGKYVSESLPNITGTLAFEWQLQGTSGAFFSQTTEGSGEYGSGWRSNNNTGFDASLSSSTYKNNAPVQQRATQMYLYFYVGEYSQSAIEQTAGLNSELFNQKQDVLTGVSGGGDYVVEWKTPTASDPTWYRVYKSGWVEQGGCISANNVREISARVTLLKTMQSKLYNVTIAPESIFRSDTQAWNITIGCHRVSESILIINSYGLGDSDRQINLIWQVSGQSTT